MLQTASKSATHVFADSFVPHLESAAGLKPVFAQQATEMANSRTATNDVALGNMKGSQEQMNSLIINSTGFDNGERLLSNVTPPLPMRVLSKNISLQFLSAIPTFGPEANYIALLHKWGGDDFWKAVKGVELFCSGPENSHRSRARLFGGESHAAYKAMWVLQCDWPAHEAHVGAYEVFLYDGDSVIGHAHAAYTPNLLGQYSTVLCVPTTWNNPATHIYGLVQLPQWMEYNLRHGIDHFLVYTMDSESESVMDVFRPYLAAGLATRVHLNPLGLGDTYRLTTAGDNNEDPKIWQSNDCLYRVKNHTRLMMPTTYDIDEYFRMVGHENNQSLNHFTAAWDGAVKAIEWTQPQNQLVHSVSFSKYGFPRPHWTHDNVTELQMSSTLRQPEPQPICPKFIVNPKAVNTLFHHWVTSWVDGAVGLSLPIATAVANHYALKSEQEYTANKTDSAMLTDVSRELAALESRFNSTWADFAAKLALSSAPSIIQQASEAVEQLGLEQSVDLKFSSWIDSIISTETTQIITPPSYPSGWRGVQ